MLDLLVSSLTRLASRGPTLDNPDKEIPVKRTEKSTREFVMEQAKKHKIPNKRRIGFYRFMLRIINAK